MLILCRIPEGVAAVFPASDDHREFSVKRDTRFGHGRLFAEGVPGLLGLALGVDPGLAFSVVAVAPGLEHNGAAELLDGAADVFQPVNAAPWRDTAPAILDELLFDRPVLGNGER